jgi:Flp pilus assembly protein CpaB
MKKQRRGWIWLIAGVVLALVAGVMTFDTINDATTAAVKSSIQDSATTQVLVAAADILPNQLVTEDMVSIVEVPVYLAPLQAATSVDQVTNRIATSMIASGSFLIQEQLVNPADPNAPVLYTIDKDRILMAIPATALLGNLGFLKVGDRVDIAYTTDLEVDVLNQANEQTVSDEDEQKDTRSGDVIPVTFYSLQNVEIKGLAKYALGEESATITSPDALIVAVNPQDALVIKYLMDTGADMEMFLRAPGNDTLSPMQPVDQEYLINRFQLHLGEPVNFIDIPDVPSFEFDTPVNDQIVNQTADQEEPVQTDSNGN